MQKDLSKIKLLVVDIDGVLTDGKIIMTEAGDEIKNFNCKDGSGIKYFNRAGGKVAIITGRDSALVLRRAGELGIESVRQNCKSKLPAYEEVLREHGVSQNEVAVVGDDLPDLPMLLHCGFAACPADAVEDVASRVDYVCKLPGGAGCVREVIEMILRSSGRWQEIMARYL
ncbi:MAG TPA: HAD family hydrolase [Phycisphaerae bacterium]|nr:HAD family hydrolase [Phycisphaerae bacterium]HPS52074.1 HAD family hydrolase [Phycisphaerae bacterium]